MFINIHNFFFINLNIFFYFLFNVTYYFLFSFFKGINKAVASDVQDVFKGKTSDQLSQLQVSCF